MSSPFNFNSLALRTATVSLHAVGRNCRENNNAPLSAPFCKNKQKPMISGQLAQLADILKRVRSISLIHKIYQGSPVY